MRCAMPLLLGLLCLPLGCSEQTPASSVHLSGRQRTAIIRELSDMTPAGFARRLGPDYDACHRHAAAEKFPEIYLAPTQAMKWASKHWQIGGPPSERGGDFSSTQGQILYVPADPAANFGCDRVTISEWTNGVFTESPEPPWHDKFRPDPMVTKWQAAAPGPLGQPLAAARGMGGWANLGLVLHASGFIGTSGTSTAWNNSASISLPPEKLVTALSVTNKSELALVTCHDRSTGRGQVAVIIITASSKDGHFVHEWPDDYPGLPNVGLISGFKLLGYIDLPEIAFPTSICAVGNRNAARINGKDGNAAPINQWDIRKPEDRRNFYSGSNAHLVSTAGFAIVGGKYENKIAFIDLQPLFERIRAAYFTTEEAFQETRRLGAGKLWPPTFEACPAWKPVLVKTVDVARPTAVIAALVGEDKAQALVAAEDGTLTAFATAGLGSPAPVEPDKIVPLGQTNIGPNPVCLTYVKGSADAFIAAIRGQREIVWIKATPTGPVITRRLRDARLRDPVGVEQADTHGIETGLITVADFQGGKILNYRLGAVHFVTQGGAKYGCGPDGKDEFECGGTMEFPGHPFAVSATNVN